MLNKEQIEKAKEILNNLGKSIQTICKKKSNMATSIEILLQYIDQLEQENNKQNKIIDLMAKWIYEKDYNSQEIMLICERNEDYYSNNIKKIKQYFEKKVEKK